MAKYGPASAERCSLSTVCPFAVTLKVGLRGLITTLMMARNRNTDWTYS